MDIMQSDQTGGSGIGGTIESFPRSPGSTRAHVLYTWAGRVVHVAWLNTTLCVGLRGVKLQMITTIEFRSHVVSGGVKCYNN